MKIQPIISNITFKGQPIIRHSKKEEPVFKGHPYPAFNYPGYPGVIPEENRTINYLA